MMITKGEEFTFTVEELTFSATEQQDQDWLRSISGILDRACTQNVFGEDWPRDFEELSYWPLQYLENDRKIRGIGGVVTSGERMVKISCLVFAKQMTLEESVILGNRPLLISKTSMAKIGIILDMVRNRIRVE